MSSLSNTVCHAPAVQELVGVPRSIVRKSRDKFGGMDAQFVDTVFHPKMGPVTVLPGDVVGTIAALASSATGLFWGFVSGDDFISEMQHAP